LESHWTICGEAAHGREAVEKAMALRPDLVLMDISMPLCNGLEATKELRKLGSPAKIVILSMHDSAQIAKQAKEAGAQACLVKTCGTEELLRTISTLLDGLGPSR
jgi:DNA-binding NarL/FixJ family response regulator